MNGYIIGHSLFFTLACVKASSKDECLNHERYVSLEVCSLFLNSDVLNSVGKYLDTESVLSMACVSRQWHAFLVHQTDRGIPVGALVLRKYALRKYVERHGFGALKWKQYFGGVEKIRLPLKMYDILRKSCPFFKGKRVKDTHILFYMPKEVDGKPLTLNHLEELVKKPKKDSGGNPIQYKEFCDHLKNQYGKQETGAPHWVLMTRDVISESRNRSFEEQCRLIPPGRDYEVSRVLETAVGVFLHYVETGERLLPSTPQWTRARCQEQASWGGRVVVGGFVKSGLHVDIDCYADDISTGVVFSRKFSGT